jgi:hypothetical protein
MSSKAITILGVNSQNWLIQTTNYKTSTMQEPVHNSKNKQKNIINSKLSFLGTITLESRLALAILTFTFVIIWFFNIGEYKTYIYNYSFCLALAGVIGVLQSFFYSFAQITRDLRSQNWFTVGMDILFNLFQVVFLISGVREMTQRVDPFNTSLFVFYASLIFFAQIYINKSYSLFKTSIICSLVFALIALIFRVLLTYTPSSYLDLIWAVGSYSVLVCSLFLFFATIKFSSSSLTKS